MKTTKRRLRLESGSANESRNGWVKIRIAILVCLFFVYTVADLATSASSGQSGANRLAVHLSLIGMSVLMLTSTVWFLARKPQQIRPRIAPLPFLLFPVWVLMVDLMSDSFAVTRIGLLIWWFSLFSFSRAVTWYIRSIQWASIPILILLLVYSAGLIWGAAQIQSAYSVDFVVSGFSYFVVALYPVVRLLPNAGIKNISYILIILITLSSLKRGAIILLVVFVGIELLTSRKINGSKLFGVLTGIIVTAVVLSQTAVFDLILQRFSREELAEGSGRNSIYSTLLDQFRQRSFGEQLLGSGSGSVGDYTHVSGAHNDVLEMLIAYGIVGFVIYLAWIFSGLAVVKCAAQSTNISKDVVISAFMAIVYLLVVGLFSQGVFGHASVYSILILGCVAGLTDLENHNEKR